MEKYIWLALVLGCVVPIVYVSYLRRRLDVVMRLLEAERSNKRSISASYGRITEQWFPLMDRYPYDSANFRFLGTPLVPPFEDVDGASEPAASTSRGIAGAPGVLPGV